MVSSLLARSSRSANTQRISKYRSRAHAPFAEAVWFPTVLQSTEAVSSIHAIRRAPIRNADLSAGICRSKDRSAILAEVIWSGSVSVAVLIRSAPTATVRRMRRRSRRRQKAKKSLLRKSLRKNPQRQIPARSKPKCLNRILP